MNEQAKNEKNAKEESDLEAEDEGIRNITYILNTEHCTWMYYLLRLEEKWNNSQKVNRFKLLSHGYHGNAININDIMFDLNGFSSLFLPKIKRIQMNSSNSKMIHSMDFCLLLCIRSAEQDSGE